MTIYIAGGITGDENYKAQFAAAKRMLLREGEDRLDITAWYYGTPRADTVMNTAELPAGWPGKVYVDVCLAMIRAADLVAFLPGWEQSRGASLEMEYCRRTSLPVYNIEQEQLEAWMRDEER
jgi:hypothetical protein